jgi:hypothetical protein
MANLSLSCLGLFQVTLDGQLVMGFESNSGRPHRGGVLAGLPWLKGLDRDTLSNLRYALTDLFAGHSSRSFFVVQQVQSKGDDYVSVQS